jgi:hypothetical protein
VAYLLGDTVYHDRVHAAAIKGFTLCMQMCSRQTSYNYIMKTILTNARAPEKYYVANWRIRLTPLEIPLPTKLLLTEHIVEIRDYCWIQS